MTDEQRQRIWEIENSCDGRTELAERIVGLEDELAQWERLTAGVELPEYPITQFQPKDLERENAKLRELLQTLRSSHDKMCTQRGNCFGCAFFHEDDTACPYVKVCLRMRELRKDDA